MMTLYRYLALVMMVLILGGCVPKQYGISEPKHITLKIQQLRFNDLGFIRHDGDAVQVELFSAGHTVERFEIDRLICVRQGCMGKATFNGRYLHAAYPDDLLQQVMLGRAIFEGEGMHRKEGGFIQTIQDSSYDITYRVDGSQILFKDTMNHILIKIRDVSNPTPEDQ